MLVDYNPRPCGKTEVSPRSNAAAYQPLLNYRDRKRGRRKAGVDSPNPGSPSPRYSGGDYSHVSSAGHLPERSASATMSQIEDNSVLAACSIDASPSIDYGEAESAMGLTRKVGYKPCESCS
jgi:hypothetical protein